MRQSIDRRSRRSRTTVVMEGRNSGCGLDLHWLKSIHINVQSVKKKALHLMTSRHLENEYRIAWLVKAITLIDLTTLGGDDTVSNVSRLCYKAHEPLGFAFLKQLGFDYSPKDNEIHAAAICIYPSKVTIVKEILSKLGALSKIKVAAVATGFPSGQFSLETRLAEIKFAIDNGANEIDIVIDRSLVLTGQWDILYREIQQMKNACSPDVRMKTILAAGELCTLSNVYKASLVAMMAGSDFIKTSTGKETVNATLEFGIVMARAIRDYHEKVGYKVGLKPAGGIRTSKDALFWMIMIKEMLGDEWLNPELFRFGASGLLTDIECNLYGLANNGAVASPEMFAMG